MSHQAQRSVFQGERSLFPSADCVLWAEGSLGCPVFSCEEQHICVLSCRSPERRNDRLSGYLAFGSGHSDLTLLQSFWLTCSVARPGSPEPAKRGSSLLVLWWQISRSSKGISPLKLDTDLTQGDFRKHLLLPHYRTIQNIGDLRSGDGVGCRCRRQS